VTIDALFDTVGREGIAAVVGRFYARIPADPILGPMYPAEDLAGAEQRLLDFIVFRTGGPQDYIERRGHPRLRMRHGPFAIDRAARDRWVELMTQAAREAVEEREIEREPVDLLLAFLGDVATFLMNRPS